MSQIIAADGISTLTMKEEGGQTVLKKTTDVSAVLRRNEQLRQAGATKTQDGDHLMARIEINTLNAWALKKGLPSWHVVAQDDRLLDQFLSEHSKFRIYEGRTR